jgi:membrane protein required for colicin V production
MNVLASMNWADWTILAIVAISSLISIKRGFVKEAISLAIWVAAFFVAVAFHERLAVLLSEYVSAASLRYVLSYALLFIATLIVGAMINHLVAELVKMTGLSGTDRLLGVGFGLVRGMVIVMAVLILVPLAVPVQEDLWWHQSLLIPQLLLMEQWCKETFSFVVSAVSNLIP